MARSKKLRSTLTCQQLETRLTPSTLNWTNKGEASDGFADTFGNLASRARANVQAAIDDWSRVVFDLKTENNTLDLFIYMDGNGNGGQSNPAFITADENGRPTSAKIRFGKGDDGFGGGYYLDPTPNDNIEFTGTMQNPFAGNANTVASLSGGDFYSLALYELTHAIGVTSATGTNFKSTIDAGANGFNGVTLTNTGQADVDGNGTYFVFDGPSVDVLMTNTDGGQPVWPAHTAEPRAVTFNGTTYYGTHDSGNWTSGGANHRVLIAPKIALMLKDVYGYTIDPGAFESFLAVYDETNQSILVRGSGDLTLFGPGDADIISDDTIDIYASGSLVAINVGFDTNQPGNGFPGVSDPIPGFGHIFSHDFKINNGISALPVKELIIQSDDGNDTITIEGEFFGMAAANYIKINGGVGNDLIDVRLAPTHHYYVEGGDGNDRIHTGNVADSILGGAGHDSIYGYGGNDSIGGELGSDLIYAGDGDDKVVGGTGSKVAVDNSRDVIYGENGNDLLAGDDAFIDATIDAVVGFGGHDDIHGGPGIDTIAGQFGNDLLIGGLDNDTLDGGEGSDKLIGGTFFTQFVIAALNDGGNDNLFGGTGHDQLFGDNILQSPFTILTTGAAGRDLLDGGTGIDQLYGQGNNDLLIGGLDNDILDGGTGNDGLIGDVRSDGRTFVGNPGDDTLRGGDDDDLMIGDHGDVVPLILDQNTVLGGVDTMDGGNGRDALYGQGGFDKMAGGMGSDNLYGGDGHDHLVGGLIGTPGGGLVSSNVTLGTPPSNAGLDLSDDLLVGGAGNDTLVGDNADKVYLPINNHVGGNDRLEGNAGFDDIFGQAGDDLLAGGQDRDDLFGGSGNDTVVGGSIYEQPINQRDYSDDLLEGGDGADVLAGDNAAANMSWIDNGPKGGADTIKGGGGNDTIYGQAGDDTIRGDAGSDTVEGGKGYDFVRGGADGDTLNGNEGDDVLVGEAGGDRLNGGDNDDFMIGGDGADTLTGGFGDDLLIGGSTTHDSEDILLHVLHQEWASNRTYQERFQNLTGQNNPTFDQRWNGNTFLNGAAVLGENYINVLTGGAGQDLFFAGSFLDATDEEDGELVLL